MNSNIWIPHKYLYSSTAFFIDKQKEEIRPSQISLDFGLRVCS